MVHSPTRCTHGWRKAIASCMHNEPAENFKKDTRFFIGWQGEVGAKESPGSSSASSWMKDSFPVMRNSISE